MLRWGSTREHRTPCRDTSLIRNRFTLAPYSRFMSKALWWSWGGWAVSYERGTPVGAVSVRPTRRVDPAVRAQRLPHDTGGIEGGSGDTTPCRMTRVTSHSTTPCKMTGVTLWDGECLMNPRGSLAVHYSTKLSG